MNSIKRAQFQFRSEHYTVSYTESFRADCDTIYSADIGGYSGGNAIVSMATRFPGCRFVMFTDSSISSHLENLEIVHVDWTGPDARLIAKYFKVNSTQIFGQNMTNNLWIDANVELIDDKIMSEVKTCDLALFKHDKRSIVPQEIKEIAKHGKDTKVNLDASEQFLSGVTARLDELPLYQGRIIFRRMTAHVAHFESLWWSYILSTTYRDQISLPVALDVSGVSIQAIAPSYRDKRFQIHQHKKYEFRSLDGAISTRTRFFLSKSKFWLAKIRSLIIK